MTLRSFDPASFAQQAITFLCLDFNGKSTRTNELPKGPCASGIRSQIVGRHQVVVDVNLSLTWFETRNFRTSQVAGTGGTLIHRTTDLMSPSCRLDLIMGLALILISRLRYLAFSWKYVSPSTMSFHYQRSCLDPCTDRRRS
jgi:hypothetical protein